MTRSLLAEPLKPEPDGYTVVSEPDITGDGRDADERKTLKITIRKEETECLSWLHIWFPIRP